MENLPCLLSRPPTLAVPTAPMGALALASARRITALHSPESLGRKLKVLCLHGYGQNGQALREKSGSFRKPLKKSRFEMHYLNAPYGCTAEGESQDEADADPERRAWWRGSASYYAGWEESLEYLELAWKREEFDGVLGFSQGAAAAAMLCASLKQHTPRFAIFVSGFVPRDETAAAELLKGVNVPSLHVIGRADGIVVPERSWALTEHFEQSCVIEHDGGHMLPSAPVVREKLSAFLEPFKQEV
ncbi:MAG: hypothetical protein SGPRY_012693 [Prymnesium sp.]